jgi:hypothetical protein
LVKIKEKNKILRFLLLMSCWCQPGKKGLKGLLHNNRERNSRHGKTHREHTQNKKWEQSLVQSYKHIPSDGFSVSIISVYITTLCKAKQALGPALPCPCLHSQLANSFHHISLTISLGQAALPLPACPCLHALACMPLPAFNCPCLHSQLANCQFVHAQNRGPYT